MKSTNLPAVAAAIATAIILFVASPTSGIDVKIGTVAPQESPWDNALRELAAKWHEITDGEVSLKIYPDGVVGDEPDLIRKMRLGRLSGAALTQLGLSQIVPEVMTLSTPFVVRSSKEFTHLITELRAGYEAAFREEGYIVLSWGEAGWVRFFATERIETPADLSKLKLAVPAGEDDMLQIWRTLGFAAVPLAMGEYAMGLQTGMVESFYAPPAAVAAFGWYGKIGYMNELPVAPVMGAIIVTERSWQRIPPEYRARMAVAAESMGRKITEESLAVERQAVEVMLAEGVTLVEVDDAAEAAWRRLGADGAARAVGTLYSEEAFRRVTDALGEFRGE